MTGVVFDFAEKAEHFEVLNYHDCRVYIPKSQKNIPHDKYYFWSRDVGNIIFGKLGGRTMCIGSFFSILNDFEKEEFVKDFMPEINYLI